jgi:hypothetical protein
VVKVRDRSRGKRGGKGKGIDPEAREVVKVKG